MTATVLILFFVGASIAGPVVDWRIVGGSTAEPHQFPFIASLREKGYFTCGGSLIAPNWVVTAAHCVYSDNNTSSYTVTIGTNQLNSATASRVPVVKIIVHPKYNKEQTINDVALLQLSTPVQLSDTVDIVDLESDYDDSIRDCTLIGWGRTSNPGYVPNDLQFLNLETFPHDDCQAEWVKINPVVDTEICTFTKVGEGACYGDSGSPLIIKVNGKSTLIAIVSWGSPCAKGRPDVYTRISSFREWILENIQD